MVFDLAGLLRSLHDADVDFIVIGGIAVAAHSVVRATEDLDVVPKPDAANLGRLLDLLERARRAPAPEAAAHRRRARAARGAERTKPHRHDGARRPRCRPAPPRRPVLCRPRGGGHARRAARRPVPSVLARAPPDDEARPRLGARPGRHRAPDEVTERERLDAGHPRPRPAVRARRPRRVRRQRGRHGGARGGRADPAREQVGALRGPHPPRARAPRLRGRARLHAAGGALAARRGRQRRHPRRLSHRGPWRAARSWPAIPAPPPRSRSPSTTRRSSTCSTRSAAQPSCRCAWSSTRAGARAGGCTSARAAPPCTRPSRRPRSRATIVRRPGLRLDGPHGLRGAGRRRGRPPAGPAAARRRGRRHAARVAGRAGRAAGARRRGRARDRAAAVRQRGRHRVARARRRRRRTSPSCPPGQGCSGPRCSTATAASAPVPPPSSPCPSCAAPARPTS